MSNIIKSASTLQDSKKRVIELRMLQQTGTVLEEEIVDPDVTSQSIIENAKKQAAQIVEEAISYSNTIRQQVLQEKSDWEVEKQRLHKQIIEEAYETGILEGRSDGYKEYENILAEAREIIETAKKDYEEYLHSSEEAILQLAIRVSEKILASHLKSEPSDFIFLVKNALKEVKEHSQIKIYVSPQYYQFVVSQKQELLAILTRETDIFIYPQEELGDTHCVIESSFGKIDASIDSQLLEVKEKLLALLMEE
ncbi:flagellar assembly protein FliH [Fredinandcohnia sp. 179-A 10B2 NHS]|uniref:flagellar assembly protein FliH n=1 Tax=Fredinandcohnia sp. 179-A 10B2 NHS TaxID=3235176 RepID=UPI00399F2123